MSKIDNALLLARLFKDDLEVSIALSGTIPYLSVGGGRAILIIRCPNLSSLRLLNLLSQKLVRKIEPLFGYEIYLECLEYVKEHPSDRDTEKNMVAVAEQQQISTYANGTETSVKLLNLTKLVTALGKPVNEVKLMLARQGAAVYPQEDGTEAIAEPIFDAILLRWAKSIKEESEALLPESAQKTRKSPPKLLTQELTIEDIAKNKTGKSAGQASLNATGIQSTLEKFFNKVKLDDSTLVDAVSAFVEGNSEFGQGLRKKLLAAYKKFTPSVNLSEVESKLVEGAKKYLEAITASVDSES